MAATPPALSSTVRRTSTHPPAAAATREAGFATARIALPHSKVRLSAGRTRMSDEAQTLCFFAGANSIFYGEKLLTAGNSAVRHDQQLLAKLGLSPQAPFSDVPAPGAGPAPAAGCPEPVIAG